MQAVFQRRDSKPAFILNLLEDTPYIVIHEGKYYQWTGGNRYDEMDKDDVVTTKPDKMPFRVVRGSDVTLIAETMVHETSINRWLEDRGMKFNSDTEFEADYLTEFAGRACYLSFNADRRRPSEEGKQNSGYIDHIRSVGHNSITEHSSWSFLIDDFSKNCTQELVRHRVGVAYSIQSSRYVDQFSNEYFGNSGHSLGVYVPPEIQDDEERYSRWLEIWSSVVTEYNASFNYLRDKGYDKKAARSVARHIIPGSMCNAVVFTVNARELNHIFSMRGSLHADPEIRYMTLRLWDLVWHHNLFSHWLTANAPDGTRYLIQKANHAAIQEM